MTLRAYITNLGKYNEGELVGQWVDFPCDEDDFEEILKEIGVDECHESHDGSTCTSYEEWFVTDYDCELDGLASELGEYPGFDELNGVAEALEAWDNDGLAEAVVEIWGIDTLLETTPDDYLYFEAWDDEDIGYYFAEELDYLADVPDNLRNYFDYEALGRDIRLESNGGLSDNGYFIERN